MQNAGDMDDAIQMEFNTRVKVERVADQTFSGPDGLNQLSSSSGGGRLNCNEDELPSGYLECNDISSDQIISEFKQSNNPSEEPHLACNLKEGNPIHQKARNDCGHVSFSKQCNVVDKYQNCESEAQTVTSELSTATFDKKDDSESSNESTTHCLQISDADLDERLRAGYEHDVSSEEQAGSEVDILEKKPCVSIISCAKEKLFSSGDGASEDQKVFSEEGASEDQKGFSEEGASDGQKFYSGEKTSEGQKEYDSSGQNEEPSGLIRANTMPSMSSNYDAPASLENDNSFKRSITERRKESKAPVDDIIHGMPEKISDRKKMKIMKKIAMVKGDGTVEFDVNGSARYAADLLCPRVGSSAVEECGEEEEEEGEKRSVPPLQIAMLIVGTRGDVQPFVAIGKHLQEYGHRVRLATHSNFEEFVLTAGLEFYPLGGDPKVLAEYMVKNKGFLPSGPSEIAIQRKQLKAIIYSLLPACTEPFGDSGVKFRADAILANPPAYGHVHVAEALKVPLHIFFTMPWTPTSKFPHPLSRVKQPAGYRLSYQVVDSLIWLGIRGIINDFRKKKLKLRPVTYLSGSQGSITDLPTGYIWSPQLVPKPEDWGPKVDVVGFCFLNLAGDYRPPESLLKWLEAGKAPIYVGFGSLPVQDPQGMTDIIVKAMRQTGQRGIINKGWGGLGNLAEPADFIYTLDNCPHDWLFPRCAAVVHHGGAGTTAAGLKAGCPTTIVPFFGDQPFWGERVHARGLGPSPIPVDQFSLAKLVDAIQIMLNPQVKESADAMSKAMENEDGVSGAVKAFHKQLPKKMPQPLPLPTEHGRIDSFFRGVGKVFGCA